MKYGIVDAHGKIVYKSTNMDRIIAWRPIGFNRQWKPYIIRNFTTNQVIGKMTL